MYFLTLFFVLRHYYWMRNCENFRKMYVNFSVQYSERIVKQIFFVKFESRYVET